MPTLKQLTCSVEWELTKTPLQEFQTTYSDGYVETYIAIPELPTPFSIHLQSNGYIAPGLSMFVYIDGVYQCNRNRQNLIIPDVKTTKKQTEVNFRVRQKEQMSWDGTFLGKTWKFERANIVSDPNVSANERAPHDGEFVGTIEVVILRCFSAVYSNSSSNSAETLVNRGPSTSTDSSSDSDGLANTLDGADGAKLKPKSRSGRNYQAFGFDGSWDEPVSPVSPVEASKESQKRSWGNWAEVPTAVQDTEEQRKSQEDSWGSWGAVPAAREEPSNKSPGDSTQFAAPKADVKMGTIEMMGANAGVYHFPGGRSSNKAGSSGASVSRSRAGSVHGSKAGSLSESNAGSKARSYSGSQGNKPWAGGNRPSSVPEAPKAGSKAGSIIGAQASSQGGTSWGNGNGPPSAEDESKARPKEGSKAESMTGSRTSPQSEKLVGNWNERASGRGEPKNGPTTGQIARSRTGSQSNQSWGNWNKPASVKAESQKGSVEMRSSNIGTYTFVGGSSPTKAGSNAGSQSGPQGGRSNKAPSMTGQQTPRTLELRGGGTSTTSTHTRHRSGVGSPVFNVGFYNGVGTPPPLNMGPPPPRNWQAEGAAKKTAKRLDHQPAEQPVADGWGDLPAFDATNDATAGVEPDSKDKIDSWNAGGSDMPGSWDTSNDQKQADIDWSTTNMKRQENNDDAWGTVPEDNSNSNDAGKNADWGTVRSDAQGNGTWPGAGRASDWDEPAKHSVEEINSDQANENSDSSGSNDNDEPQPSNDRNGNGAQQDDDRNAANGEDSGNNQNGRWRIEDTENDNAAGNKPTSIKGSKKGSKAGSVGQGSKADSVGKPGSNKAAFPNMKGKPPPPKGPGSAAGSKKGSGPGSWSPSPKSKKGTAPQATDPITTNAQAQPSFSISTVPKAKAYWSTWENPNAVEEETAQVRPVFPAEEPLYAIPEEVATRNSTSHQVRPGRPATYTHRVSRPKYMDTHTAPYAVFVFHYRDKTVLEEMLHTTITEPLIDETQRLSSLPKAELIEELLKEKARSASISSASEKATTFQSNPRGIPLGPNVSALKAKLSKLEESKAPTPEMVGAWVDSAQGNGSTNGAGSANGKGNWGKNQNNRNKGNQNKGGGNWVGNANSNRNISANNENPAGEAWNTTNQPSNDKSEEEKKDNNEGNWGGFNNQDVWQNEEYKVEGNGNGFGAGSWDEVPTTGGGGGGW